jgi:hypothetical protein
MLTKEFTGASVLGYVLSGNEMFEDTKWQAEATKRRTDNTMANGIRTTSFDIYVFITMTGSMPLLRLSVPEGIIRPVDSVRPGLLL